MSQLFRIGGVFVVCMAASAGPAVAQYPGQVAAAKQSQNPRAIAVFEFTGDAAKPTASRLIPVSYFFAGEYQDAGIYLAQPEPIALGTETEYELQRAGVPAGAYDVDSAGRVGDAWIGYGDFKAVRVGSSSAANGNEDDVRPRMTKKSAPEANVPPADSAKTAPNETATPTKTSPLEDKNRPTLKRKAAPIGEQQKIPDEAPAVSIDDPDRPHLGHTLTPQEKPGAKHLVGNPPGVMQMIAVSDATTKEPHPFAYTWSTKDDQAQAERKFTEAVRAALTPSSTTAAVATPASTAKASHRSAVRSRRAAKPATGPEFVDVHITAYALTYENTPALVLSARTSEAAPCQVTAIAEVDIYGEPRILFTSITDTAHLADTPEMHLVDAVDADGSNRASLLFELRGAADRQFALYRVSRGVASRTFVTGSIPYQPPIPAAAP